MSDYIVTPKANADLLRIWLYIAQGSGDSFIDRLLTTPAHIGFRAFIPDRFLFAVFATVDE